MFYLYYKDCNINVEHMHIHGTAAVRQIDCAYVALLYWIGSQRGLKWGWPDAVSVLTKDTLQEELRNEPPTSWLVDDCSISSATVTLDHPNNVILSNKMKGKKFVKSKTGACCAASEGALLDGQVSAEQSPEQCWAVLWGYRVCCLYFTWQCWNFRCALHEKRALEVSN